MNDRNIFAKLFEDHNLNVENLIYCYIDYVSIFYCKDIKINDDLKSKIHDVQVDINNELMEDGANVQQ